MKENIAKVDIVKTYKMCQVIVFALLLSIGLFLMGWFCAKTCGGEIWKELENSIQETARETQIQLSRKTEHIDQRLDAIEGKIDVLIRIATAEPMDLKRSR